MIAMEKDKTFRAAEQEVVNWSGPPMSRSRRGA
jgi:hypothetical protein